MKVKSPDGTTWCVTRRWLPWRRRLRGELPDAGPLGDDPISTIIAIPFLVVFVVAVTVITIELLVLLVALPFAIVGRIWLGRHWTVEVRRGLTPWHEEPAGDFAASRRRKEQLAGAIERGDVPVRSIGRG